MTTPNTTPELLPCPFCGSTDTYAMNMGGWESFCKTCGTNGPALNTEKDKVIADWNTRTATQTAKAAPVEGVSVPPGFALVPLEPNRAMLDACLVEAEYQDVLGLTMDAAVHIYRAMVAAAPQPPASALPLAVGVGPEYDYAASLATSLFKKHFSADEHYASGRVQWGLFNTTAGVLTQIDDMVAGLVRPPVDSAGAKPKSQYPDVDGHNNDGAGEGGEDALTLQALRHYIQESDGITIGIPFELAHAIMVNLECQSIGIFQYGKATVRPNSQDWAGMDGATAYHLIERHADGWDDIRLMMTEWLTANAAPPPLSPPATGNVGASWLPLSTAPRDGTPIDLWHVAGHRETDVWWDAAYECWSSVNDDSAYSHWMPTPTEPTGNPS